MATRQQSSPGSSNNHGESTNSYEGNDGTSDLAFVTYTGRPKRNPATQKKIRKHVMHAVGKAKRGDVPLRPRQLKVSLEVPESSAWSQPNTQPLQSSYRSEGVQGTLDSSSTVRAATFEASYSYPTRSSPSIVEQHHDFISKPGNSELSSGTHLDESYLSISQDHISIERFGGGRSNPFVLYPIEMNLRAHELVDHIFDDEYSKFRPFRESWFPVGLMDPAAFHQVLANSALSLSHLRAGHYAPESYESITHHSIAMRLVNSRMPDPMFARSDGLIGSVMAFSCYHVGSHSILFGRSSADILKHIIGESLKADIHFAGLKEIIRLRGGPDSPDFHPLVRLVLSWVDIGNCSEKDVRPNYPIIASVSGRPTFDTHLSLSYECAEHITFCRGALAQHTEIVDIIEDVAKLTVFLQAEVSRTNGLVYANTMFCASYINPLLHRLLSLPSDLSEIHSSGNLVAEACRLSSMLYLAELRRNFGVMPVRSQVQLAKLRLIFENDTESHIWNGFGIIKLWILALAVVEERENEQRLWWLGKLKIAAKDEGLQSMKEVTDKLRHSIWMDLHESVFRPFEQEALEEVE